MQNPYTNIITLLIVMGYCFVGPKANVCFCETLHFWVLGRVGLNSLRMGFTLSEFRFWGNGQPEAAVKETLQDNAIERERVRERERGDQREIFLEGVIVFEYTTRFQAATTYKIWSNSKRPSRLSQTVYSTRFAHKRHSMIN